MKSTLKIITNLFAIKAFAFLLIPLILIIVSGGEIRSSISDYVYSLKPLVSDLFVALVFSAGLLFIDAGITKTKFYNVVLGFLLLIVALTPHNHYPIIHYIAAVGFFIGSCLVMIIFSNEKQILFMVALAVLTTLSLILHFVFNAYSLFYAEWIGMLPITAHFIGEIYNKIV